MPEDRFGIDTDKILAGDGVKESSNIDVPKEVSENLKSITQSEDASPLKAPEFKESPGFFANAAHSFSQENDVANLVRGVAHQFGHIQEEVPDDWSPIHGKFDLYKTVNEKYWGRLANSTGPEDQEKVLNSIRQSESDDEYYDNGSFSSALFGGIAGGLLSPSSLLAFSSTVKYANLATRIGSAVQSTVPKLAAISLEQESLKQFGSENMDASRLAFDTMRDTLFATAFVGGAVGLGRGFEAHKLYQNKISLNALHDGVTLKPTIKDGVYTGEIKVAPQEGQNIGAAVVDKWQDVYNNTLVKEGAFAVPVLGKLLTKINPVVKGLSHPYETVRAWTNKLVQHSLNVAGVKEGKVQGANVEELLIQMREESKLMDFEIKGAWQKSLGIDSKTQGVRAIKTLQQKVNSDDFTTLAQFNHEVRGIIINEQLTDSKSANDIAQKVRQHIDKVWERFRRSLDLPENYLPPRTARAYLMKVYDKAAISQDEERWIQVTSDYLREADTAINKLNAPVVEAQEELTRLKELKFDDPKTQTLYKNQIKSQRNILNQAKKDLEFKLRDDADNAIFLEKRNHLTTEDVADIDALNKPQVKLVKDLKKADKMVSELKARVSKAKTAHEKAGDNKNPTPMEIEKAALIKGDKLVSEASLKDALSKQDELQGAIEAEKVKIAKEAIDGNISKRLYTKTVDGKIDLRNVADDAPKLRKVFEDDDARIAAAKSYGHTITGHTAEQVSQSLLSHLVPQVGESPTSARTLMIPDKVHHEAGFLSTNLGGDIATYDMALGRPTAMREVFPDLHDEKPVDYMSRLLVEEREIKRQVASATISEDKLKKALKKIDDEFDNAKRFINNSFNIAMGRTNASLTTQKMTSIARNFTISTLLGAVPLTQVADIGALVIKNGIWRFIRDGLTPTLKAMTQGFRGKHAAGMKMDAAHAHLGMEHLLSGHMDKHFNPEIIGDTSISGKIHRGLKKVAEVSGNLFGTTYIDNQLQTVSAHMTQAKVMEWMFNFKAGTLRKPDLETMLRNGIDPKEWADKFVANFNKTGEKSALGSFNSKWYDWADDGAKNAMGTVIKRTLRETILKRGLLDNPFFTNSPILNVALLFKGWAFAATSRYTLPLLQHGEAKDLISIMASLGAGSLVDPLRKMARGENPDYGSDGQFMSALGHSGVLGYAHSAAETANSLLNQKFYTSGDKYQQRVASGMLLGPAGSQAEAFGKVLLAFSQGKIPESEAKRAIKLIPLSQAWYLRKLSAKFIEGLDLPKGK